MRLLSIAWGVLLLPVGVLAEPHERVQSALDWELPSNECKKPSFAGKVAIASTLNPGGDLFSGGFYLDSSIHATYRYDLDHYQLDRYKRAEKRWINCLREYRQGLLADFEELKNSAQYGLTKNQADLILGKMALIQSVYISPNAFRYSGILSKSTFNLTILTLD